MTELRLHKQLYGAVPVDEAVKTFERFGSIELDQADEHWLVRIACKTPARERQVRNELANFALGLSVKELKLS